jgi:hypothetical protein
MGSGEGGGMKYRKPFKPRKYAVNRELLERWRSQRLSIDAIAAKFPHCHKTTVRNWLIQWGLPTELEPIQPGLNRFDTCETSEPANG